MRQSVHKSDVAGKVAIFLKYKRHQFLKYKYFWTTNCTHGFCQVIFPI